MRSSAPRSHPLRRRTLAVSAALGLFVAACGADEQLDTGATPDDDTATDTDAGEEDWPDEITFAVSISEGMEAAAENYGPMLEAIGEDLGVDIELFVATQYAGVIEASIAGGTDLVHFGAFPAAIMLDRGADFRPVAATGSDSAGPDNAALGWTMADSDIESLEDLAGRDVCFGDPGSTTGYLYPAAALLEVGIDPEEDLNAIFTGSHSITAESIVAGDCEAGFTWKGLALEILPNEGLYDVDDIRVLFEEPVQEGGILISNDLPESLIDALAEAFIANNGEVLYERGLCADEHVQEGEDGSPWCPVDGNHWGFFPIEEDYFDSVWEVCLATEAPACSL